MPDQTALLHDERSYTEAGVRAFQQKRPVVGIMMLKAALRFDPNYAPAHVMLAAFYVMRANSDRATEHLTCALKNLPPYAPERDACLWLLSQLGQTWTDDSPLTSVIPKLYIRSVDSLNHHRQRLALRNGCACAAASCRRNIVRGVFRKSFCLGAC